MCVCVCFLKVSLQIHVGVNKSERSESTQSLYQYLFKAGYTDLYDMSQSSKTDSLSSESKKIEMGGTLKDSALSSDQSSESEAPEILLDEFGGQISSGYLPSTGEAYPKEHLNIDSGFYVPSSTSEAYLKDIDSGQTSDLYVPSSTSSTGETHLKEHLNIDSGQTNPSSNEEGYVRGHDSGLASGVYSLGSNPCNDDGFLEEGGSLTETLPPWSLAEDQTGDYVGEKRTDFHSNALIKDSDGQLTLDWTVEGSLNERSVNPKIDLDFDVDANLDFSMDDLDDTLNIDTDHVAAGFSSPDNSSNYILTHNH